MSLERSESSITSFSGAYRFLSNFYPCPSILDGIEYSTLEHSFQAAKTRSLTERWLIFKADSPGRAKRLGRKVTRRPDWEQVKLQIMADLLVQKFSIPSLRAKLMATGNRELIEGNDWGDRFWGVCRGEGINHLGRLLMIVRNQPAGKKVIVHV